MSKQFCFILSATIFCVGCSSLKTAGVATQQDFANVIKEKGCIEEAIETTDGVEYIRSFRSSNEKHVAPAGSVTERHYTYRYSIKGMAKPKDRVAHVMLIEDVNITDKVLQTHYINRFSEFKKNVSSDDLKIAKEALRRVDQAIRSHCSIETLQPAVEEF